MGREMTPKMITRSPFPYSRKKHGKGRLHVIATAMRQKARAFAENGREISL